MLPEVPRQVLHLLPQPRELPHRARRLARGPTSASWRDSVSSGSTNSNWCITLREAIDVRLVELERLPHLARRAPAAIGDDVGRHRRAVRPYFS